MDLCRVSCSDENLTLFLAEGEGVFDSFISNLSLYESLSALGSCLDNLRFGIFYSSLFSISFSISKWKELLDKFIQSIGVMG